MAGWRKSFWFGTGLSVTALDEDLVEWDYGQYEGVTTREIRAVRPGWDLWRDGCPGGESPQQVGARLDRVPARVRQLLPWYSGLALVAGQRAASYPFQGRRGVPWGA
jgi:broad specificity phosphatase PhoE